MRKGTCCVITGNARDSNKERDTKKRCEGRNKITGSYDLLKMSRVHSICHIYFSHIYLWVNDVFQ